MYKSFIENEALVEDMYKFLKIDKDREEIIDIFEDEDGTFVETEIAEMGFTDDGCRQLECDKVSCLNCIARQIRKEIYTIKLKEE